MASKALTRDDLIYILNETLKFSKQENNALELKDDGLYVESHTVHSDVQELHMPSQTAYDIVSLLTVDQDGFLRYNGTRCSLTISDKADNALLIDSDNGGLYIQKVYNQSDFLNHIGNAVIHINNIDRNRWDSSVTTANAYTDQEINKLSIRHVVMTDEIPEHPDHSTLYLFVDENTAENVTMAMYFEDTRIDLGITKRTLDLYYTKLQTDDKFLTKTDAADTYLPNTNATNLQNIANDNGHPVFTGKHFLSSRANNGLSCDPDGGLYFPDVEAEIRSLSMSAAFSKTNLLDEELQTTGSTYLKDNINNYNALLIEYYYFPQTEGILDQIPMTMGYAKTAIVDPDTMEYLYRQNVQYALEIGYGLSNCNVKIRMHNDLIFIDYQHDVFIYKITGIGKTAEPLNQEDPEENGGGD